eukprot:scaffold762_cov363-Pavlova_lutheri.AAC.53
MSLMRVRVANLNPALPISSPLLRTFARACRTLDRTNGVTSSSRRTSPVVDREVVPRARGRHGRTQVDISTISSGSHPYAYFTDRQRRKTTGAGAYPFDAHALRFTSESSLCTWTVGARACGGLKHVSVVATPAHVWKGTLGHASLDEGLVCWRASGTGRVLVAPLHRVPLSSSPLEFEPLHPSRIDRAPKGPHR